MQIQTQLVPLDLKNRPELLAFIKLNKRLLGADALGRTEDWKTSIPFWVTVNDLPVGTTGGWANERYTDGETYEAEHPGWLYIGDLSIDPECEDVQAVTSSVMQFWIDYAREHRFKLSTNEVETGPLVALWKEAGLKETKRDELFGAEDPNVVLELEF